jgi:hypothetical protein
MDTNNNEHADELNQTIVHLDTRDTLTFIQANTKNVSSVRLKIPPQFQASW